MGKIESLPFHCVNIEGAVHTVTGYVVVLICIHPPDASPLPAVKKPFDAGCNPLFLLTAFLSLSLASASSVACCSFAPRGETSPPLSPRTSAQPWQPGIRYTRSGNDPGEGCRKC